MILRRLVRDSHIKALTFIWLLLVIGHAAAAGDAPSSLSDSDTGNTPNRHFEIPAQPMAAALSAFAEQAALQSLLYTQSDLENKTSMVLSGRYSVEKALRILLDGSGLGFRIPQPGIVVIQLDNTRPDSEQTAAQPVDGAAAGTALAGSGEGGSYTLEEVVTIGTRVKGRKTIETAVPVDIFSGELLLRSGAELGAQLQAVAPSFNFSRTTVSDGSDIVRPASLRGLSPDHLLVLINGKRRHHQAQINIQQVVGRGSSGTDINAIPISAIERIEVLRDGAAAQYGSDAIAGVINVVLKARPDSTELFTQMGETRAGDGETRHYSANTGMVLGEHGFFNLTLESQKRAATNRAGVDTRFDTPRVSMEIGDAETEYNAVFFNGGAPVESAEAYFFGGLSRRDGLSAGFYRGAGASPDKPPVNAFYVPELYPFGFLPRQTTRVEDEYLAIGIKDETIGLGSFDASITYGENRFSQGSEQSVNVSLGVDSPLSADSGSLEFNQLSVNLDLTRHLDLGWHERVVYLATGVEFRNESYRVHPGDFASYAYGPKDDFSIFIPSPIDPCPDEPGPALCADGSARDRAQAGMQAYPGFRTKVDVSRDSLAVYFDAETDLTEGFTLGLAARAEHYSGEGSSTTGKLSFRYQWRADMALRGAFSSGFRAPGLNQRAFTNVLTNIGPDVLTQTLQAAEGSEAVRALGAGQLEEERSLHWSLGLVWQPRDELTLTLDWYRITIADRIVLTDVIAVEPGDCARTDTCVLAGVLDSLNLNVGAVQLFTNGIDTSTLGGDFVVDYEHYLGAYGSLGLSGSVHYNRTRVERIHPVAGIEPGLLFSKAQQDLTETGQPRQRLSLSIDWSNGPWRSVLRVNRYGKVQTSYFTEDSLRVDVPGGEDFAHKTPAAWLTDLDLSYRFASGLELTLGANNLFDVYPDKLEEGNVPGYISGGSFVYPWESTPFGINGAFYYARLYYSL